MSGLDRPLAGDVLLFDLAEERKVAADPAILERSGRVARTLVKDGPLRVTLVTLAPGGRIAEHQADGPITVQPTEGTIRFIVGPDVHELRPGQLLAAGPGIPHAVESDAGATFLLTVSAP